MGFDFIMKDLIENLNSTSNSDNKIEILNWILNNPESITKLDPKFLINPLINGILDK